MDGSEPALPEVAGPAVPALSLTFPKGNGQGQEVLPLGELVRLEARQQEIAITNKFKAPELMVSMNRAWLRASNLTLLAHSHLVQARKCAEKRRAVILLDLMPEIMRQKGIAKSSEAVRDAVLAQDVELEEIQDRIDRIEAVVALLKIKAQGFDNAFRAVKKILDTPELMSGPTGLEHELGR